MKVKTKYSLARLSVSLFYAIVFAVIILGRHSYAQEGKVLGVSEGDTITILHGGTKQEIKLYGIDSPAMKQKFGKSAQHFTSEILYNQTVLVKPLAKDQHGRTVGIVYMDGQCLNAELIKAGYAWVDKKSCDRPVCQKWFRLEKAARIRKIGLWAEENPVPP